MKGGRFRPSTSILGYMRMFPSIILEVNEDSTLLHCRGRSKRLLSTSMECSKFARLDMSVFISAMMSVTMSGLMSIPGPVEDIFVQLEKASPVQGAVSLNSAVHPKS